MQKSLIGRDEKLTLNAAIDVARSYETTCKQMKSLIAQGFSQSGQLKLIELIMIIAIHEMRR